MPLMKKHPSLGRPGAGACALVHAHARQLALTLLGISRDLRRMQPDPSARAGYREVERALRRLAGSPKKPATRRK